MTIEERNKWLLDNMGFIYEVCQKYRCRRDFEDCVQTAFIGAIAALDRIREDADEKEKRGFISRYINGYVLNYCIKTECSVHVPRYAYDIGVRPEVMSMDYEYDDEETFGSIYVPYNEPGYEEAEVLTDLKNCISDLTEKLQRTALMLYEGYTRRDIAEMDHCSQNAIYLRIQELKKACSKQLYA